MLLKLITLRFESNPFAPQSGQRCAAEGEVHQDQNRAQHKQQRHHAGTKSPGQADHPQQNRYRENCPKHKTPPERAVTLKFFKLLRALKDRAGQGLRIGKGH